MPSLRYIKHKNYCPTSGKSCFEDKALVRSFINANHAHRWRYYQCPDCGCYHVTRKKEDLGPPVQSLPIIHKKEFKKLLDGTTQIIQGNRRSFGT